MRGGQCSPVSVNQTYCDEHQADTEQDQTGHWSATSELFRGNLVTPRQQFIQENLKFNTAAHKSMLLAKFSFIVGIS